MVENATNRDNRRISSVSWPRGNTIWKDQWVFVSQMAGSDIFHLVIRLGFCTEPFASGNEWMDACMHE